MPGLFGYIDEDVLSCDDQILRGMRDLLIYVGGCKSEPFYHKDGVHAGYCAPSYATVDQYTNEVDGVVCWCDGEIYNADELTKSSLLASLPSIAAPSFPSTQHTKKLILSAYKSGNLMDFLVKTDGYFSAVIHDTKNQQIKLITDRFGFRPLFYAVHNGKIIWASECKAFLAISDFRICVDRQSVDDFMKYAELCDDLTWLDGVRMLDAATVLTFDIQSGIIKKERYWLAEEIKPLTGKVNISELCEEWGRLFKLSVAERAVCSDAERSGLFLSGGLDSRAILAAMPEPSNGSKINAVTQGDSRCDDVRLASVVAQMKRANHTVFPQEIDGWLERALFGIWVTDGAVDLTSQQGTKYLAAISKCFDICMNGIGGGPLQGGRVLGSSRVQEHGRTDSGEPGLQMLRRRAIRPALWIDEAYFKVRMPFFDSDLYNFVIALPREVRAARTFYWHALLHNFPEYYKDIPWQQAGVPISLPKPVFEARFFYNRVKCRFKRKLQGWGLPVHDSKLYFDVPAALHQKGNRELARTILSDKNAIWPNYVSGGVNSVLNGNTKMLCRVLTFEIYMRQLSDPQFRKRSLNAPDGVD